ncbi:Ribosomal protein L2 [Cynara cardunculus var. scolymus]|uniref:Ribosomal protein L2 n=1 Tax=Cynara cardunculus var. scolymus TaxID=59895 RepID=A0A103XN78_CYNCS|nr:Ribosomal protein L2 [Cynara cardunculus var. scolymus]
MSSILCDGDGGVEPKSVDSMIESSCLADTIADSGAVEEEALDRNRKAGNCPSLIQPEGFGFRRLWRWWFRSGSLFSLMSLIPRRYFSTNRQLARAADAVAKLIAKEGKSATLKLPYGEVRLISKNCSATVRQVGNVGVDQKSLGKAGAGSKRCLCKRIVVRGVVMNPVDHPYGGGEERAPIGRKSKNHSSLFKGVVIGRDDRI